VSKGKELSKVDLSEAYNQLALDEESSKILTWSTYKGLFKVHRLPYDVAPASAIFQKLIEQLFQGHDCVANFLDDIIITGQNRVEHLNNLDKIFNILNDAGLKVKLSKCEFFKSEIEYLGHIISAVGLRKCENKVIAIVDALAPRNITQVKMVKSFAGMVNYYSRFLPNVSIIMKPIYNLLTKNKRFCLTLDCQLTFDQVKELFILDKVLVHFNPNYSIILSTDASRLFIA